jgi:hypothetical protein
MTNFDTIFWGFIFSAVGIAFGWFLNELGQWFRTRKEDKKIKNQILYNLLEINFVFNQLETSEITQLLADRILVRIPKEEQTEELKQSLNQFYSEIIGELLENNVNEKLEIIEAKYSKALDDLATIDPITAYRLNGKANIMQIFDILHDYFDAVKKQFPGEEEVIQDQINSTIYSLKPEVIKEAISDLEDEIKDLALSINPWIWFKVRKTLQSSKDRIRNEDAKKIDKLLDKLMSKITQ